VAPSLHIKPKDPKQFVTPAPGAYNPDGADKDVKEAAPKYSFGIKTKDAKKYVTPAPGAYEAAVPDENQPKSFGIKHSPYVGALKGDDWVSARTETVTTMPTSTLVTNGHNNSNTVVQNTSGGGSKVTSNTRTHSDGQRIRTETFSYTEPVRTVRTSTTTRSTQQVAA